MKYICVICKQKVELRRAFTDKSSGRYPKYHIVKGQPCHGFYLEEELYAPSADLEIADA